jgi:hypothetical protein
MFNFWNWKFNPFTQIFNPANFVGEQHIVAYDEDANAYGIRLNNLIELQGSLPFNTNINYSIHEDVTGGAKLTETPRTNPPDAGQFRVDYSANTYFSTSFIEFNSADDGLAVIVNYRQLGTVVKARYQLLSSIIFPANVGIEANLEVLDDTLLNGNFRSLGDVSLAETTGSIINLNDKQAENMGDPINEQDGVNLRTFQTGNINSAYYTADDTFVVPDGITDIIVEIAGGGGGGGGGFTSSSASGAGGGQSKNIAKYAVTPGESIAITIGAGGVAGTTGASPTAGGVGGSSVFGSYITLTGGGGGASGGSNSLGGIGSGNDAQDGGNVNSTFGGHGGGSGGRGAVSVTPAQDGKMGGGGGGGSGSGAAAGAGGAGYVKIWW